MKRILITAGPTKEYIDPVRYITNNSSGILGYEIAKESAKRGCEVLILSSVKPKKLPSEICVEEFVSAKELMCKVMSHIEDFDVLFMTSAVADYRPASYSAGKIKRKKDMILKLVPTRDILKAVSRKKRDGRFVCGFCVETGNLVENAVKKLREKKLDLMVANLLGREDIPFGDTNMSPVLIFKNGDIKEVKNISKKNLAKLLVELALNSC